MSGTPLLWLGHVWAVDVCKPASSTRSTGRVTDLPYPAGDTGGQRHIPPPYSGKNWRALNFAISAKTSFTSLVCFKFGDSGLRPLNVTSPLQCKRSLQWLIESLVVCNFKLREGLAWPGRYRWGTFPPLPSLEGTRCTLR